MQQRMTNKIISTDTKIIGIIKFIYKDVEQSENQLTLNFDKEISQHSFSHYYLPIGRYVSALAFELLLLAC